MKILIIGKVENTGNNEGVLIKYFEPVVATVSDEELLIEEVTEMLEKNELLRVWKGEKLSPFIEIVDRTGDEIQVIRGLDYVENIVDVLQLQLNEGDIIIDVYCPEKTVDEKYYDDIFFLREQDINLRTKHYEDGTILSVLEYFGKTHANIKLTKVEFSMVNEDV